MQLNPTIVSSLATLGTSICRVIESDNQRKASESLQQQNFTFQKSIEENRQNLQLAQMKIAILQHEDTQKFQDKLANYNYQKTLYIEKFRQEEAKKNQWDLAKLNHEYSVEIEQFRQLVQINIHEKGLAFQKWKFEQEKQLQYEILVLKQEFQRELSRYQQINSLEQLRERIRSDRSPITNLAFDLLQAPFLDGVMPLRVLLSPPVLDFDSYNQNSSDFKRESFITEKIRQFMSLSYHINSKERPTELLDKAWESKKYGGGAAINQLYNQLKSIPVLILESELVGTDINLRYSYWTGEQTQLVHGSILSEFSTIDFLQESAERKALAWKAIRIKLKEMGKDDLEIKRLGGNKEHNLQILEKYLQEKEEYEELGIDVSQLMITKNYQLTQDEYKELDEYLAILHCLVLGITADWLFLKRSIETTSLLPSLLPDLLSKLPDNERLHEQIVESIAKIYRQFCNSLELEFSYWLPEISLRFADSFLSLPNKSYASEEANFSVKTWLELNKVNSQRIFVLDNYEDIKFLRNIISEKDRPYFNLLEKFINKLDNSSKTNIVQGENLLASWQYLHDWREIASTHINEFLPGGIVLEMIRIPAGFLSVDEMSLEMLKFPAGKFIASSQTKKLSIKVEDFLIGKYPITQNQYMAIMGKNPSSFKNSPHNPVECIKLDDAEKFCLKLSQLSGRKYRLPTTIEWEYACRANSQMTYYFGDNEIDLGEYAWYGGNSNNESHPVGQKKPNYWGLYDMHGGISELCTFETKMVTKSDNIDLNKFMLLRGGSWRSSPQTCKSENYAWQHADFWNYDIGFRVVLCL
jgi:formylglycine-generating enzyme required for sulfatase activity